MGVVSFSYLPLELLSVVEDILSSTTDSIQQIHDRHVLVSNDKGNELYHNCPIMDFLKSDIYNSKNNKIIKCYERFVDKYSKEKVDLLILDDERIIQNKILHILNFAMDSIYKSDTMRVEFYRYKETKDKENSIPNLIYSTIGENFDIKKQYLIGQINYIIIKKRS
jgi:hypothetical protein